VFNVTGGELVIILLVALIVLGPDKLPDAIRKVGRVYGELRRMSQGFQSEIRDALDEPMREVRDTMNTMKNGFTGEDSGHPADPPAGSRLTATNGDGAAPNGTGVAAEVPPEPEPVDAVAEPEPPEAPAPAPAPTIEEMAASPAEPSPPPKGTEPAHREPAPENERTA